MAAPVDSRPALKFDPQGHQMGALGTLATQLSLMLGMIWALGALTHLLLPPSLGILTIGPVLGALLLAPRPVVMEFPISFSILGIFSISIASVIWTIDDTATSAGLKGLIPAMLAITLAGGLLSLRDFADGLIWTIHVVVIMTFIALLILPDTRSHIGGGPGGDDYAGWHGLFNHKNNMTPFLAMAVPTLLTFQKPGIMKWTMLGMIGVLLVGSTSATGVSAAFFAAIVWLWLKLYQNQEDARNSTLLAFVSFLGSAAVVAAALSSIATITSAYGKDTTFSGRTEIWEASIDALIRQPWLGYGFGALFWREGISNETAEIWRQVGFEASHAHNGPLDLALQVGLVGLAIFGVLWLTTLRKGLHALNTQPDLGIWVVSVMASNFLMALSEDVFYGGWLAMFAVMKMLLMRRPSSLNRPSYREVAVQKWA